LIKDEEARNNHSNDTKVDDLAHEMEMINKMLSRNNNDEFDIYQVLFVF
jgi:hypothetical protein